MKEQRDYAYAFIITFSDLFIDRSADMPDARLHLLDLFLVFWQSCFLDTIIALFRWA